MAQEKLIKASPIPYTIVRATQFFEFVGGIARSATEGQTVRLPPVLMQPIVSDDVAAVMADAALAEPLNGTVDLAGPEPIRQDDLVRQFLHATAVDLRVGGRFSSRMEAKDGSAGFDFAGTYTKVVPHELIECTFGDRTLVVQFIRTGNGVTVRETFDAEGAHTPEQQRAGWQA